MVCGLQNQKQKQRKLGPTSFIASQYQCLMQAADMPKPVPSDFMVEQPIQESPAKLKAKEVQEDMHAQHVVAQAASKPQAVSSGPSGPSGPQSPAAPAASTAAASAASSATSSDGFQEAQLPAQMSPSPVQALQAALQETFAPTV